MADKTKVKMARPGLGSLGGARKDKKMTKTEGSFAKGGRAGYKGGKSVKKMGCAIKGKSPILR